MANVKDLLERHERQQEERRAKLTDEERAKEDQERKESLKETVATLASRLRDGHLSRDIRPLPPPPLELPEIESPFPAIQEHLEKMVDHEGASTNVLSRIADEMERQDERNESRHLLMLIVVGFGVLISFFTLAIVYQQG